MLFPVIAAQLISSNDQQTVIGLLATALGILVVALARVLQVWLNTRSKLVSVKGEAKAASIKLDESKEEAALKNLQLVQQQVDDQKAQLARMQAREAARDTSDKILTDLVAQVGEIKIAYAQGMQTWATQMQTFSDVLQGGNEKRTDRIISELGLAVKDVNNSTKELIEQVLKELRDSTTRLESAIKDGKTDAGAIVTTLTEHINKLDAKLEALRVEQAAIVKAAAEEGARRAAQEVISPLLPKPVKPPETPIEPKDKKEDKP